MSDPVGLFPLPPQAELERTFVELAGILHANGYGETGRLPHPGAPWHVFFDPANVRRYIRGENNSYEVSGLAPLFYKLHAVKNPKAHLLFEAFGLSRAVSAGDLERTLPPSLFERLLDQRILVPRAGGLVSRVIATPIRLGDGEQTLFHDIFSITNEEKLTHVFLGRCSVRLLAAVANALPPGTEPANGGKRFRRGIDLCTGSGVQALNLTRMCDEVIGGDVNPRALAFARANASANNANATFHESDLWSRIPAGQFDIVTANTPFLLLADGSKALSGNGGHLGIEIAVRLYEGLDERLAPGGISLVIASTAIVQGKNVFADKLTEIFRGKGYEIDLFPINTYYTADLYDVYQRHGVDKCHLYAVRARKVGGTGLQLRVHDWAPVAQAAYTVAIATRKTQGWMKSRRRAAARPG